MRRRNGNRQMGGQVNEIGGRQRAQRRDGTCRFEGPGMRMNLESDRGQRGNRGYGRGVSINVGDSKEFLTQQKEILEQRINCVNEQLENLE